MDGKELREFTERVAQELCDNLKWNGMMANIEYVEKGIRDCDESYFRALRMRGEKTPNGPFLHLTAKIEEAIRLATKAHTGQFRKGEEIKVPYISHPLSVAEMLAQHTQDEDILVAAILHDTLEDCEYTKEKLRHDFGEKVCRIVQEVTEDLELKQLDNKGTWRERKILYLAHLYRASFEAKMVCCADKIHNLANMIHLAESKPSRVWVQFNSSPEDRLWFYKEVTLCLKKKLNHPIVGKLEKIFEKSERRLKMKQWTADAHHKDTYSTKN